MRQFVAVTLGDERAVPAAELKVPRPVARHLRAVPAANLHVTLAFLGEQADDAVDRIAAVLAGVALPAPFTATVGGLGVFPSVARARVLWRDLAPHAAWQQLAASVAAALTEFAPPDRRSFAPHLTLGRFRTPPPARALGAWLDATHPAPLAFPVAEIALMRSDTGAAGVRYRALATRALAD